MNEKIKMLLDSYNSNGLWKVVDFNDRVIVEDLVKKHMVKWRDLNRNYYSPSKKGRKFIKSLLELEWKS